MKLYFQTPESETFLMEHDNYLEMMKFVDNYIRDELNYKSYYTRQWMPDKNTAMIDYGEHDRFFVIKETSEPEVFGYYNMT